jgi:ATP-dependent DNA ligase
MAVYDPVSETYQSLCRCMSGFTDAFYAAATERLMVRCRGHAAVRRVAASLLSLGSARCCPHPRLARPAAARTTASRAPDIMSSARQPAGGAALVAQATRIPGPKAYYVTNEQPSVWFEPTEVWELRGADLTLSPVHKAAVGQLHQERGVGLRFPRCV